MGLLPATAPTFQFVGLALDLVSQDALSEERIDGWLSRLHAHLPG